MQHLTFCFSVTRIADHCFILDPAQNSASEEQAIDRIHRIGQHRAVKVIRFIMQGTIEERILLARRNLVTDKHQSAEATSAAIDGFAMVEGEEHIAEMAANGGKRNRLEDEETMGDREFQRLQMLELLFGASPVQEERKGKKQKTVVKA